MLKRLPVGLWIALVLVATEVCTPAFAQEYDAVRVVSDGVGTIYTPPSHIVFPLLFDLPEGDFRESLVSAEPIIGQLREYLGVKELRPVAVTAAAPHIASFEGGQSTVAVELRFSMSGLVGGEVGIVKLGDLLEEIKALGVHFGCRLSDPDFVIAERNVVIQEAVREATKNAYSAASGAAEALATTIRAVEQVRVVEIVWNAPPDTTTTFPTIDQVGCTAKVQVTYQLP